MTLTVRRRRAVQLQLDRVNESSVPLSQLPPQCGYSVQTTWRDLSLMAQYDACHITQEDDSYVLPLLWRGTPVKMSCPASQIQPEAIKVLSSLCCSSYGLTVKVHGLYATEEPRVNVRGEWTPLVELVERCGYTLERRDTDMVIAAPYITCGITVKDGKYTFSLQIGRRTFTLACPVRPPDELTHQPLVSSSHHHLTEEPAEQVPLPWAPPFYLAPPYYPHPTNHHKYLHPDGHDAYNPPPPSSHTPDPTFGPQPLPPVDSQRDYQDYYHHQIPSVMEAYKHFTVHSPLSSTEDMEDSGQVYPDLQQKQEAPVLVVSEKHRATLSPTSDSGFPIQVEPAPLQPPSHAFNPYYHYYHHPKIPLPGPPQDLDPGPEVHREQSLPNPPNHEYPELPPSMHLSGGNSHQFLQPIPEAASHPDTFPSSPPKTSAPNTPNPPQPYPHQYSFYFPHIALGEAKRVAPLDSDTAAKVNLSNDQNAESSDFFHPRSSHVRDRYNLNPYTDSQNPDKVIDFPKNVPEQIKLPFSSEYDDEDEDDDDDDEEEEDYEDGDDVTELDDSVTPAVYLPLPTSSPPEPDAVASPPADQPSLPTPSPNHNLPLHPRYHHPYYYYYQMYNGPEGSLYSIAFPASSEQDLDPLPQASSSPPPHSSYRKHQTTTPPANPMYAAQTVPLHPYYYYDYLLYQPAEVTALNQEMQPAGSVNSNGASNSESLLPSENSGTAGLVSDAEGGYHSSFHSLNSHYISQQHLYDHFGPPGGDEAEETELEKEMKDHLEAIASTPSASPCSLGSASEFDSLGCCSYPVKDCTVGQHFVFVVPESVVEPTVAPAARSSELSNVTCTMQKMTSDPDVYAVPLQGCGVNKHVVGETVVHLLEVHGVHTSVLENSPVRLMVECSSSPGSPGEVRLHVMDEPPPPPVQSPPAILTVQLRIATDESFSSFHPEAHLPLSLMRGRLVYVEVSLLDPPEPGLVLLVHSCLAYTPAPYTSWMLVYDGCPVWGDSQLLPSPRSDLHHIRRIVISAFLPLPSESPSYMTEGGNSYLEDPEIYFLCLTEVCSAADGDCTVGCINKRWEINQARSKKK